MTEIHDQVEGLAEEVRGGFSYNWKWADQGEVALRSLIDLTLLLEARALTTEARFSDLEKRVELLTNAFKRPDESDLDFERRVTRLLRSTSP